MVLSDVVIYASPLYKWDFGVQMKSLIERFCCLYRGEYGTPVHKSFVEGQRYALIITMKEPFSRKADIVLTSYHKMLMTNKAISVGELFICNCSTPDLLGSDIRVQANNFAIQISHY